jgi:hypothetical protein
MAKQVKFSCIIVIWPFKPPTLEEFHQDEIDRLNWPHIMRKQEAERNLQKAICIAKKRAMQKAICIAKKRAMQRAVDVV